LTRALKSVTVVEIKGPAGCDHLGALSRLARGRPERGGFMRPPKKLLPEKSSHRLAGAAGKLARTHLVEEKKAAIKLEDGSLFKGKINILAEPAHEHHDRYDKFSPDAGLYYKRISDMFTRGANPFVVVFDVTLEGQEGRVLVINKNKILWVSPED
jgi:hypothetical protein